MTVFEFKDYRDFLKALCSEQGTKRGFQASLAKASGCQASYFSRVLQSSSHLTEDQAIAAAEKLTLTAAETEYFLLLIRLAKAGTEKAKSYLGKMIENLKAKQTDLSTKLSTQRNFQTGENLGKYFASWIPSVVHLLTSSNKYQTMSEISKRLQLPQEKIQETLLLLVEMGLVEKINEKFIFSGDSIHVPKDSHWQPAMQASRRQLALNSIAVNPKEAIHFSSLFTISEKEKEKIKELLGSFVKDAHQVIEKSGTEALSCLCLDFFDVL